MMRGVASTLEKHHRVQLLDEALEAAVQAVAPLHPGAPAARQGGEPARHRLRARGHQPARGAGRGRGLPQRASRRWRPSWRSSAARRRSASTPTSARRRPTTKLARERERLAALEARWKRRRRSSTRSSALRAQAARRRRAGRRHRQRARAGRRGADGAAARRPPATTDAAERARERCSRELQRLQAELRDAAGRVAADPAERRRAGGRLGRRRLDRHPGRPHGQERDRDRAQARRHARASASSARTTRSR